MDTCSIIIPAYNRAELTKQCLEQLFAIPPKACAPEVIVVNDGSTDQTTAMLGEFGSRVRVVAHERNLGFAQSCNDGAAVANGDFLVFLNNDTISQTGWLDELLEYAGKHPKAAVVGSKLLYPDRTVQHAGMAICQDRMPRHLYLGFAEDHPAVNRSRRHQAVTGACMLIRRTAFTETGGFDTVFVNGYEDIDLCLRLQEKGLETHYCHRSVLIHLESQSQDRFRNDRRNLARYRQKWAERVQPDDFRFYLEDGLVDVHYRNDFTEVRLSPQVGLLAADFVASKENGRVVANRTAKENTFLAVTGNPGALEPSTMSDSISRAGVRRQFGVNLIGHFQSEKGVGEGARAVIRALDAAAIPYVLYNVNDPGSANQEMRRAGFRQDNPYAVNLLHLNADEVPHFSRSVDESFFRGRHNVGFWNWELSTFPDEWRSSFRLLDEVWTPSTFTRDSVATVSPVPVQCIPYCLEEPKPAAGIRRSRFNLPEHAFMFLFAFDLQSYIQRKNPLAIIEAFQRAFGDREDVMLVLKTSHAPPDGTKATEHARLQELVRKHKNFHLIDSILSRGEMQGLVSLCDAYVSLHRSEGFGFPLAEAMALGKPVIGTAYSSNVDFMNETNSLPVRYRMIAIEEDYGPYQRGAEWADPDVDHAAELMRRVADDRAFAREVGIKAKAYIAEHHSAQCIGELLKDALESLLAKPERASAILAQSGRLDNHDRLRKLQDLMAAPIQSHRGRLGKLIVRVKRLLHRMLWPVWERQTACNMMMIETMTRLHDRLKEQEQEIQLLRELSAIRQVKSSARKVA